MKTYQVTSSDKVKHTNEACKVNRLKNKETSFTTSNNSSYKRYEIVLLTDDGEIHFDSSIYKISEQLMISAINAFVSDISQTSFNIVVARRGSSYLILAFASVFLLISIFGFSAFLKAPPEVVCNLDTTLNRITLKYSTKNELQHSLDEINNVQVEEKKDTYRVNLILASGQNLPLTYIYSSSQQEKQEVANYIKEFLGR